MVNWIGREAEVYSCRKVKVSSVPEAIEERTLHLVQSIVEAKIVPRHRGIS